MSSYILHIAGASRFGNRSVIAGDRIALLCLRDALNDALLTGSGGAALFCADGEPHALAIVRAEDMTNVCTTYADEPNPVRSKRETTPVQRLPFYLIAQWKADRIAMATQASSANP